MVLETAFKPDTHCNILPPTKIIFIRSIIAHKLPRPILLGLPFTGLKHYNLHTEYGTKRDRHTFRPGDNYLNPGRGAARAFRSQRRKVRPVFQRAWLVTDARRSSKKRLCVPAAHSVRFPKSSPARIPCVPRRQQKTAASTRR